MPVSIKFLKKSPPFNAGEVAGVSEEVAAKLYATGNARPAVDEDFVIPDKVRQDEAAGERVVVQFTRKCKPYNPNETAGFSPAQARALIEQGFAKPFGARAMLTKDATETPVATKDPVIEGDAGPEWNTTRTPAQAAEAARESDKSKGKGKKK